MINALIERDRVEVTGEPYTVDVARDSGGMQRIHRCPTCATALFSEYTRPDIWFVRAGTLDDPDAIEPDVHIFTRSKVPWVRLPENARAFDVFYDVRELWPPQSLERVGAS